MRAETISQFKNYLVRIRHENEGDCHVDLEVFAIVGEDDDDKPYFERKGAMHGMDTTQDINDSQRVIEGSIKWDGCSHLSFFPDDEGYHHYCGKTSAVELGELLGFVYDEARKGMTDKVHDLELYEG